MSSGAERPPHATGAAFGDALASALAGDDLMVDGGFGPDTERALIDLSFARGRADEDVIATARTVFAAETALRTLPPPSSGTTAMSVLTRMAHCSLLEWGAARAVPVDMGQVRFQRACRRRWLARLATADTGYVAVVVETLRSAAMPLPSLPLPPARIESDVLAAIFEHDIVPETSSAAGPRNEPGVLVLSRAGTPPQSALRIAAEHRCVVVDPDLYTAYHPRAALAVDAGVLRDVTLWMLMAIRYAIEHRLDVVVRIATDEPRRASAATALFTDSGYRVIMDRTPPVANAAVAE